MKRLLTLSFQFYRLTLLYNIALTICAALLFAFNTRGFNPMILLPAKLIGFASAIALHYYASKQSYYYFLNTGYRMRTIFSGAFMLDVLLYFSLTLTAYAYIKG